MVFNCPFTYMEICNNLNIKLWERKINFEIISQKRLTYFNVSNKKEYISLIIANINNEDKLKEIYTSYKTNQLIELDKLENNHKQQKELLIKNSKFCINDDIFITLLSENDIEKTVLLYKDYKNEFDDKIIDKELNDYIEDVILKNEIYGIFINNILIGCCICKTKSFIIDNNDNKVETYYIQEIFIKTAYKGKKYGGYLFKYIINTCPNNLHYISFMTKPVNTAMYKIATNNNFELQKKSSGDINNSSLFILKKI